MVLNRLKKLVAHPLLKSSLIYTLCDAINKAVPFLILPILSYYLTPGDYGIVANFTILLSIVTILVGLSVEGVIGVNYYRISKEELGKYIFNALVLILGSTSIVLISSFFLEEQIYASFKIPYTYILLLIAMAVATTLTAINLALWRLEEKPMSFGIYQITQTVLNIAISLFLVINMHLGWIGRVQGMLTASFIFGAYSFYLLLNRGYLNIKLDKQIRLAILAFGLPLIPHSLSIWVRSGIDRVFITNMYDEEATGLYATGFMFGTLVSFLILAFNNAFVPYLYKSLSELDPVVLEENKKRLKKITYFGIGALFVVSILFYGISVLILENLFSVQYIDSKEYIFWAIISQMFQGFYLFFVNYIFFMKKTKSLALITFSCALIQVVLSYFFIKELGPLGGAYSTVIVSFLNFCAVAAFSNRIYKMNWFSYAK